MYASSDAQAQRFMVNDVIAILSHNSSIRHVGIADAARKSV